MATKSNATSPMSLDEGLKFPPSGVDDLATVLRPRHEGGTIAKKGQLEVVSSLQRNWKRVFKNLRWGVYVVLKAPNHYSAACFKQYGMDTDDPGRYAAVDKPFHLIGPDPNIAILSAVLLNKPTRSCKNFSLMLLRYRKKVEGRR